MARLFRVASISAALLLACEPPPPEAEPREAPVTPTPATTPAPAVARSHGGTIYIPTYSHVYIRQRDALQLTVTLSIRNTSETHPITLDSVDYYDTHGDLVRHHIDGPKQLDPLATAEYLVERRDASGGSGANFLVKWSAEVDMREPLVEAVMVNHYGTQAFSFTSRGTVVYRNGPVSDEP